MVGKKISRLVLALGLAVGICLAADSTYPGERYKVIVDRSPFGANPLAGDAVVNSAKDAVAAAAASSAAEKELRLCFLLRSQTGEARAGFENKIVKTGESKSIILMVGESFRGMKLLNVDLVNSSATMDRSGSKVTFELAKRALSAAVRIVPDKIQHTFGGGFR